MRHRVLLFVALVTSIALLPAPARAGGWWSSINLDGRHLGIGEKLTVRSEVLFSTVQAAEEARRTQYHAYLLGDFDQAGLKRAMTRPAPKHWWTPPKELILVGDVELSQWDSNLAMSTANLAIPEMRPGRYHLMLCDSGCRAPLGDLIPQRVVVSSEPLAAQSARKLQETKERLNLALARVRHDLRQSTARAKDAQAQAAEGADAIARLEQKLSSSDPDPPSTPWLSYAGWFLAGVAGTLALTRRRRQDFSSHADFPLEQVPDDPRELAGTKRG